jgi:hypothetical protein
VIVGADKEVAGLAMVAGNLGVRGRLAVVVAAVAVLGAACVGREYPVPGSATSKPSVVLFGDSLLAEAAPLVEPTLGWYRVTAPVVNRSAGGVGVLDDGFRDYALGAMDAPPGSVFVIQFSGNCFFGPGGGCPEVPGSGPFFDAWKSALTTTVIDARDRGLVPLVVAGPHMGPQAGGDADTAFWVGVIALVVAQEQGVAVLDWGEALHDVNGEYQDSLWYADVFQEPRWHQVRDADGIHLALPDGGNRAAAWLAHKVSQL